MTPNQRQNKKVNEMESTITKLKTIDELQIGDKFYVVLEKHCNCWSRIESQPYSYCQQTVDSVFFNGYTNQEYISSGKDGVRIPIVKGKASYALQEHCGTVGSLYENKVILVTTDEELAIAMYNELRHATRLVKEEVYKAIKWVY